MGRARRGGGLMRGAWLLGLVLALLLPVAAVAQSVPVPPVAAKRPHLLHDPGGRTRTDDYYWLRDDTRSNADVLAYLKEENGYTDAMLRPLRPLRDRLYLEMASRTKQDDMSAPVRERGYLYYSRFETGADYPLVARRKGSMDAPEEILLDQPAMARGGGFFEIGDYAVSQDNRLLAYAEDRVGRRQYVLRFRDLVTRRAIPDAIENVEPDLVWSDDNRTVFYIEKDPVTLLSRRVKAHVLGTPASADRIVYEEKDESYYLGLGRTASDRFICIWLTATVSNELRCTEAARPGAFFVISPRRRNILYDADHIGDHWVIQTDWKAPNRRLMTVRHEDLARGRSAWKDLVRHDPAVFIENFQLFDGFIAIEERVGGNKRIRLRSGDGTLTPVASEEPAYAMTLDGNREADTLWVRYTYDSLVTPTRTYEVNAVTRERRLIKQRPTPRYDPKNYVTERVWANARDGARIPVSIAYRKGFRKDGTGALMQYGYGAYGSSTDPAWTPDMVSLLDRGMVFAVAHVRGGQEMGRAWYDGGHLLNKKNSFTDFIDVTRALVAQRYAAPGRVAAQGGSAGGLLMGAVLNMAPREYRVIVAQVPFVDVITTMADPSIPLTTNEYDEWGNPARRRHYDYMLSYSPYDNVASVAYPALFVGTGLWDSQVQYYEPAKWVAKLRATKAGANPLLFRINMEAGHGGQSGRLRSYRETSEYYAFVLKQLDVAQ